MKSVSNSYQNDQSICCPPRDVSLFPSQLDSKVLGVSPITGTPLSSWRSNSAILGLTSVVRVLGLMDSGGNAVHPFLGKESTRLDVSFCRRSEASLPGPWDVLEIQNLSLY